MLLIATLPVIALILFGSAELSQFGILMAIGLVPAAVVQLPATRRKRILLPVVGVLFSVSMLIGALLAQVPIVAIFVMGALAYTVSYFSSKAGLVALSGFATAMVLPLIGVGLSYSDVSSIFVMSIAIVGGSVWVYVLSLFRKETQPPERPIPTPVPKAIASSYGIFYAVATLTAVTLAFGLGLEHVGWVVGATLFVMRPSWQVEKMRIAGRFVSVFIGANLAALILFLEPSPLLTAIVVALAVIVAAGTHGSRWYITPAFTTFIVFFVLLYGDTATSDIAFRLNERVIDTTIGVFIALLFGLMAKYAIKLDALQSK